MKNLNNPKRVNGIPKTERIWVTIKTVNKTQNTCRNEETYYITAKENDRSYYFLYKIIDNRATKLGKSKTPKELEDKYIYK